MKVLTAAQMREVDRRTMEMGIPGIVLMENAGHRVLEVMAHTFAPLRDHRIVVLCGKGNNGGDGLVIARQLLTHVRARALHLVLAGDPAEMRGDAAANLRMFEAAGGQYLFTISPEMRETTLVVDALLGTGLDGPAHGRSLELIRSINGDFPLAKVVAVDLPSGMQSDSGAQEGDIARADVTVTFTAPKVCHVLQPACYSIGKLHVANIGSPASLYEENDEIRLHLSGPARFAHLFRPRYADSNKGMYGHVLVIAGGRGKTGAAAMAGIAALRAGAGLSTVASAASAIDTIAAHAPEIMTEALAETADGAISDQAWNDGSLERALKRKTVVAAGPGLGTHDETVHMLDRLVNESAVPMVLDADALNGLAIKGFGSAGPRVLTPHPGEMSRLTGKSTDEVQKDRIATARAFAEEHGLVLVLKGDRTVIAFPNGHVWINPTGSPAMATGGTGDILTGLTAGLIAQSPDDVESAVLAAVWLHGRAGELAAAALGEKPVIATDLLRYLPEAMRECAADFSHAL
ncbi:MAG TPA: NAD(P)H-hydrate dehydratase [Bryobacteraceae bacterium]|nr:NAD(P)H-hydrate dehydratase [Bryobacteraceae bacterium]